MMINAENIDIIDLFIMKVYFFYGICKGVTKRAICVFRHIDSDNDPVILFCDVYGDISLINNELTCQ